MFMIFLMFLEGQLDCCIEVIGFSAARPKFLRHTKLKMYTTRIKPAVLYGC